MTTFGPIDYVIVLAYMALTVWAGLYMRRFVGDSEDFLVAGREMDVNLGIASLAATEMGIITVMYAAELGYKNGFAGSLPGIMMAVAMLVVGATGFVINPLRESGVVTIPELLEQRYGPKIRWLSALVIVLGGLLNMGIFLRIGGEFLMLTVGIPAEYLEITMTVMLISVLIYTVLGGMLSVLVTDYLQFLVMSAGIVIVSVLIFYKVGWSAMVTALEMKRGAGAFNPLVGEEMGLAYISWQGITQLAVVLTWQTTIQRVLAAKDSKTARAVYTRTSFYFVGRFLIPAFWGIAALAVLPAGIVGNDLHAMPTFLRMVLPSGLIGILIAAMLAAEMSTDSSYMLTWAGIIYTDLVAPLRSKKPSAKEALIWNRSIVAGVGVFLLAYGLWYKIPGRAYDYLAITGNIYLSSISVLLVACCYWKRANSIGAALALAGGVITPLFFLITNGAKVETAGLLSFFLAAVGMIVGSFLGGKKAHA